jgi:hypothetical protein
MLKPKACLRKAATITRRHQLLRRKLHRRTRSARCRSTMSNEWWERIDRKLSNQNLDSCQSVVLTLEISKTLIDERGGFALWLGNRSLHLSPEVGSSSLLSLNTVRSASLIKARHAARTVLALLSILFSWYSSGPSTMTLLTDLSTRSNR